MDMSGRRYIGIMLNRGYICRRIHLSMPNYVAEAPKRFQHQATGIAQHQPFPSDPINYGATKKYAVKESTAPLLDKKGKQFILQVCSKVLFLGQAIDSTLLCPISATASKAAKPIMDTMKQSKQLILDLTCLHKKRPS